MPLIYLLVFVISNIAGSIKHPVPASDHLTDTNLNLWVFQFTVQATEMVVAVAAEVVVVAAVEVVVVTQ